MKPKMRILNISLSAIIAFAFLIAAGAVSSVWAQKAPRRVTFARGATVARATGYLRGMNDAAEFVLRARAGQHMRLEISARGATRGMVTFPSGKQEGAPGGVFFDDNIDENGDYRIGISESSMGDAWRGSFTLKIEILPGQSSGSDSGPGTSDLARYVGQYPSALLKGESGLKTRLRELLGANYASFTSRLQTEMPIERDGDVMIARGCMAHQCTIEEAILAVDLSSGKPYVAIKSTRYGGGFKIFAEDKDRVPNALRRAMQQE
jgi:hypothetical protein